MDKSILKIDIINGKYKHKMLIPDYFRKYVKTLTMDDIKFSISKLDLNNKFKNSSRSLDCYSEYICYMIKNGYPLLFFNNALDYKGEFGTPIKNNLGFVKSYFDDALNYMNELGSSQKHVDISESGILFTDADVRHKCHACDRQPVGRRIKYYDYYLPKNHEYLRGITLCSSHMENLFNFAEKKILEMYNILLYKYKLIKYLNLDIDSNNYIFMLCILNG